MKLWPTKILFLGIIILTIIISSVYLFMLLRGNVIITKQLEELTHRKVTMGYFNVTLPFNIEIYDLNIEGLGKVEKAFVSVNPFYFLTGSIVLSNIRIVSPQIVYERVSIQSSQADIAAGESVKPKRKSFLSLVLKRLNVKDGKIDFIDRTVTPEGIMITAKDINFNLVNIYTFPFSVVANFELNGSIPWQEGKEDGKIEAEGWINFFKKDMQATLEIKDIDGVYLYPYYSNWVDLEKARIESAKLNFASQINGLNNNLTAECHLELTDIVRTPRPHNQPAEKAEKVADAILGAFKESEEEELALDFTVKTKMDRPEFGFSNIKTAVEERLTKAKLGKGFEAQHILKLPAKLIEGTVRGATEISKAVIDGTFAVGNEFKKAVADSFRKE